MSTGLYTIEKKPGTVDEGVLKLSLHPGQSKVMRSPARFVFMIAGTQGGKTSLGPWWMRDRIAESGAGDYLAATSTFDLFKLKMLPEVREVFEDVLGVGRYWSGIRTMELRENRNKPFLAKQADDHMWGRIILRSAVQQSGLEAATAKAAWLDEIGQDEWTLEKWEAILRRLSLYQGRVLGTTTLYNLGWMKHEVYERWRAGDKDYDVVQFPSIQNPAFPIEEFERARRTMPAWRFDMFYRGIYAKPAGLIYRSFKDEYYVNDFEIPVEWEIVACVDFGGANTAILYLALNPNDNRWYVFREYLGGGISTAEHAKREVELTEDYLDIRWVGGAGSEEQERRDWRTNGINIAEPDVGGVEAGISRVIELIKGDRLRVFKSCKGLRDELGSYRRKLDDRGEPTEEILHKRHFHRLDGLRYGATSIIDYTKPSSVLVTDEELEEEQRRQSSWQ